MSTRYVCAVLSPFVCVPASAELFQPVAGVASSEFSGSYDIGNTIDGSGLVGGLSLDATHADYGVHNHWTTRRDAQDVNAVFEFDEDKTVARFVLWNHRSNVIADDPNYAVRVFDLTFFDANDTQLGSLTGLTAEQDEPAAQLYDFAALQGVRSVRIDIVENYGSRLSGFGEVAFSSVPAPGSAAVLAATPLVLARRRR